MATNMFVYVASPSHNLNMNVFCQWDKVCFNRYADVNIDVLRRVLGQYAEGMADLRARQ